MAAATTSSPNTSPNTSPQQSLAKSKDADPLNEPIPADTSAFLRPLDMPTATARSAPPFETCEHTDYTEPWSDSPATNGHEPVDAITEPIAVAALHDRLRSAPDDLEPDQVPTTALAAEQPASAPIGTWIPDRFEFGVVRPWYRTKPAAATLAAVALAAIAVSSIVLVSRGTEQATSVTPEASTTAGPPPSSAQPAPSHVPPAASNTPPAPPPPPSASTVSRPPVVRNQQSWSPNPPSPTKKPEIGVTRPPISAPPRRHLHLGETRPPLATDAESLPAACLAELLLAYGPDSTVPQLINPPATPLAG